MKRRNFVITLFLIICISVSAIILCACNTPDQECTHDGLAKINAKAPTCTDDGNIEYWHCGDCLKNFADANGTTELDSVTAPSAGHSAVKTDANAPTCTDDGNIEYWHCSACLKNFADANGTTELDNVTVPSTGHKLEVDSYQYEEKMYHLICNCHDYSEDVKAGSAEYPYLVRNEGELRTLVAEAAENSVFKLANDIDVTTVWQAYTLPEGSTLDLGGYTVNVTKAPGCFIVEGVNVTLQNGAVDLTNGGDYSLFIGDESDNNSVTVKNVTSNAGFNVYNCVATIIDCNVDASECDYYALWADAHSTIIVESGTFVGGKGACVHSTTNADEEGNGNIILNGGTFNGDIIATVRTEIHGGVINGTVKLNNYKNIPAYLLVDKDYTETLNIVCENTNYELVQTTDEDGNKIYQQANAA